MVKSTSSYLVIPAGSAGIQCRGWQQQEGSERQVPAGEIPTDYPSLVRLEEHGYIVPDQGRPRLRVPLFEDWLRKYRGGFPAAKR